MSFHNLPFDLDQIHVASPCHENWGDMSGDERARFCGSCEKHVYNLSDMTREAAMELIREKQGHLCVRFYRRTDGTVLTQDCPTGVSELRKRKVRRVAAGIAAAAAGIFGVGRAAAGDLGRPAVATTDAAALVQPSDRAACSSITYTVAKGDTLTGIAKTWQTDVATLREANPKVNAAGDLQIGDKLVVPVKMVAVKGDVAAPRVAPATATTASHAAPGDNDRSMIMGEMVAPTPAVQPAPVQPPQKVTPAPEKPGDANGKAGGTARTQTPAIMGIMICPAPVPAPTPAPVK